MPQVLSAFTLRLVPEADGPYPACAWPALPPPIKIPLTVIPEHDCPYLPGRQSETRAFAAHDMPAELYHRFMDAGFRRTGRVFYQPICRGCRACMAIRLPVDAFRPSKSQRRCRRRNSDLRMTMGAPSASEEKFELYLRYLAARHTGPMNDDDQSAFEEFLYDSPVDSIEMCYYAGQRLVGVGICDLCSHSLSSVYFYFDPDESRRGLGTFSALCEIDTAAELGIPYYYLGYWVAGCRAMEYKRMFRPCEVLHPDGVWRGMDGGGEAMPCTGTLL